MARRGGKRLIGWRELVGSEDPDEWLERTRRRLLFHSHTSMHKALAEATGLTYHAIHKTLSGSRRPDRLPAVLKETLDRWLQATDEAREREIADEHRSVPVERMCRLLPALLKAYDTKAALCRALSERTGVRPDTIRRYFRESSPVSSAPLAVYRAARELTPGSSDGGSERDSYLARPETCRVARRLSGRCKRVLRRLRDGGDPRLRERYRRLRRSLIVAIKEQRKAVPDSVV